MSTYKRGSVYWYKFMWNGKVIRKSTRQKNDRIARNMESAHRTRLAEEARVREEKAVQLGCEPAKLVTCAECEKWFNGEFAVVTCEGQKLCARECLKTWNNRLKPVLTLREFCEKRFEPSCKSTTTHKTWRDFYRVGVLAIKEYPQLANLALDWINSESIADFVRHRQTQGLQVSSINSSLRILRRILRLAAELGDLETVPRVRMIPGERHRERVLTSGAVMPDYKRWQDKSRTPNAPHDSAG